MRAAVAGLIFATLAAGCAYPNRDRNALRAVLGVTAVMGGALLHSGMSRDCEEMSFGDALDCGMHAGSEKAGGELLIGTAVVLELLNELLPAEPDPGAASH